MIQAVLFYGSLVINAFGMILVLRASRSLSKLRDAEYKLGWIEGYMTGMKIHRAAIGDVEGLYLNLKVRDGDKKTTN